MGSQQNQRVGHPPTNYNYDADDRLSTDQYDSNGNTTNSLGIANAYDFENHLITHGGVTIVYDGDSNRVSEIVGGVTTSYLVDTVNPTGYAQVVDELQSGAVTRTYSYGLERINETQPINSTWTASFYGYDGHGSVRQLTNATGVVTDSYDYDAFGNLINSTGSTPNNYLFAGEQFDPGLGLYYNRARYLNTTTGRFWTMDVYQGNLEQPFSLHRYLYASGDPVSRIDPKGKEDFSISANLTAMASAVTIAASEFQGELVQAFEEGGGAAQAIFKQMGAYAQDMAREVLELDPELVSQEIEENVNVAESGAGRQVDFLVRSAESAGETAEQLFIEAKYALPRVSGEPLTRLVNQVNNAVATGQGKVVLWSLQQPSLQQVKFVYNAIGTNASVVQFVSGVEGLYRYLELYFGH